jgi:hypothetical protein
MDSNNNTWPDPSRPGYPPNPNVTAYYWIRYRTNLVGKFMPFVTDDDPFPFLWDAGMQSWLNKSVFSPEAIARLCEYMEPCPWPANYRVNQALQEIQG